jgi:hypothetical protein
MYNCQNGERNQQKMRKQIHDQLPLMDTQIDHPRAREYDAVSRILDANPIISEMVLQDLTGGVTR